MILTLEGLTGTHLRLYGYPHSDIADRLDEENWQTRWLARVGSAGWLAIGVSEQTRDHVISFLVDVVSQAGRDTGKKYIREFPTLGEAVAYANGDGDTELARESRKATPDEYPPESHAMIFITTVHRPPGQCSSTPGGGRS